ncbi:MAG: mechanosensitive ion channel family protein, partial [Alphaproteobacteria bacterium]
MSAISGEVLRKLREQGVKAGETPAAESNPAPTTRAMFQRMGATLGAFPTFWRQIGTLGAQLSDPGGRSAFVFLLLLAIAIIVALAIERLVRAALGRLRLAIVANDKAPLGVLRLIALFILDAVAVGALWLAAAATEGILDGNDAQARLATLVLTGLVFWRFNMFIFRAWLQPDFAVARIAPLDDAGARMVYRGLNAMLIITVVMRVWIRLHLAAGTPPDAIGAAMLINNVILLAAFCFIVWWMRAPVATWLGALAGPSVGVHAWKGVVTHYWWIGGIAFFLILSAAQAVGVLSGRLEVGAGLVKTQTIIIGLLLIETLMWYFAHRGESAAVAENARHEPRLVEVAIRCLRVAVRVAILVELSSIWVVEVLGLVTKDEWWKVGSTFATAGLIVFLAYVLWQIVKFQIDRYMARNPIALAGPGAHSDTGAPPAPQAASRLRTLLPLLRVTIGIAIFVLAVLIVLAELGVNTAPLIAGASIFGLALSFGSQTLVRDIVSGVFYLVDDAFRVGEYVDTGKSKGTVEGFTLRSIQLRHQNG